MFVEDVFHKTRIDSLPVDLSRLHCLEFTESESDVVGWGWGGEKKERRKMR